MKPVLISILLLLGLFQAQAFGTLDLQYSSTLPTEKNNQISGQNDECLVDFISHSLNLLEKAPSSECSREMISRFGKTELFEPALLSYLFLIEQGSQNLSQFSHPKEGIALSFEVCVNNESDDCLLQRLFNTSNEDSLVSKQRRIFGREKLSFLYTTQPSALEQFYTHGISLFHNKEKKVSFVDGDGKIYTTTQTLDSCANEILKNQFEFTAGAVYKIKSEIMITVNENNRKEIELLMKDVCTLNQFAKMIRNDGKPNLFTFYIQSLNKLSKVLSVKEMELAQNIWTLAKSKFVNSLQKKYLKNEIVGGQFFVESDITPTLSAEFPTIMTSKASSARVLEDSDSTDSTSDHFSNDAHYEAYVWTPVVLAFVVFFSVMALVNMDFSKDTLLYAKFLTNDAR